MRLPPHSAAQRLALALSAAHLLAGTAADADADASGPPNLLLISVDTLRADHLGAYGYPRDTSPAIDALAREGVLFRHAIVQRSVTWPSLTSIHTSLYPRSHGVRVNGEELDASKRTVAQQLAERGYRTAAFLSNMLNAPHRGFREKNLYAEGDRDGRALRDVLGWLEANRSERFFLWVHFLGPHDPYVPKGSFARKFAADGPGKLDGRTATLNRIHRERLDLSPADLDHIVSLYDAKVAEVDARVGRILAKLDALGLRDTTLVAFTSDHGEELYDHNRYFLHALSIYDSVLRVPLILRWPGRLTPGAVEAVVESIDIAPTLLDLVGAPPLAGGEGVSLRPRIEGSQTGVAAAISELGPHIHSLRTERWHYVRNPHGYSSPRIVAGDAGDAGAFAIAREELYDLHEDPRQQRDVAGEHPEVVRELRARLEAWLAAGDGVRRAPQLSPETREELRALGYLE